MAGWILSLSADLCYAHRCGQKRGGSAKAAVAARYRAKYPEQEAASFALGPNPVQDIDGDGRIEIVFNLFNERDDGQWHVVACDALTRRDRARPAPAIPPRAPLTLTATGCPNFLFLAVRDCWCPPMPRCASCASMVSRPYPLWHQGAWTVGNSGDRVAPHPLDHCGARGTDDIVTASLTASGQRGFFTVEIRDDRTERLCAFVLDRAGGHRAGVELRPSGRRSRMQWRAAADIDGDGVERGTRQLPPDARRNS